MFRHALKLIWNRRRTTRLVVIEIAAAYVITFVLTAFAVSFMNNLRRPLGFDYENVLSVTVQQREATGVDGGDANSPTALQDGEYSGVVEDVMTALRALQRTETVAPIQEHPWRTTGDLYLNASTNRTTAEALQAIGVDLIAGRWFGPEDEGQAYRAVLVNRAFAERSFGFYAEAVGQRFDRPAVRLVGRGAVTEEAQRELRIVGVIEEFRQGGEFTRIPEVAIERWEGPQGDERTRVARFELLLKTVPGTEAAFGEQIVETIESVASDWGASVTSWEQIRTSRVGDLVLALNAGATIAAFFIALVVMGLIGVLWQDIVRRTQEIGLRRALGAGAASVRRQIQLETLIVGAFGILIGGVIAIQFPLLELIFLIDWAASVPALALSAAAILILALLSALYPSWLASRREPADALRYE
jgi:putative ABC transport system permease protein